MPATNDLLDLRYASGRQVVLEAFASGFSTSPAMTTSEWADEFRWLKEGTSPEHGKYRTDRTPYVREILDVLSPSHPARRVVFMKGSRMGATEVGNCWLGRSWHLDRCSVMLYLPDMTTRNEAMRDRIEPMIDATPVLQQIQIGGHGRSSLTLRTFEGCKLHVRHASSTRQFRGHGAPRLFADEIDDWPREVGREGSPIALAEKRLSNYTDAKGFWVSTPTERDFSAIETLFLMSDQRRYFLRCPACGHWDYLTWQGYCDYIRRTDGGHYRIVWEQDHPETAHAVCPVKECGARIEESYKHRWLRPPEAEWRPTAPGDGKTVGFHLPSFYSPEGWVSWASLAEEFIAALPDRSRLRVWVNQNAAEPFEERESAVASPRDLKQRLEDYGAEVPAGVGVLVASADVHANRIEVKVKGYGAEEESWLIHVDELAGDPKQGAVWEALDRYLLQPFAHASGRILFIERVCIDANYLSDYVYRFTAPRESRELPGGWIQQVFAVRGAPGGQPMGRPIVQTMSRHNRYKAPLFTINTDGAKDVIMARLWIREPGPGYMHLPEWVDEEYLLQLVSEKPIRKPEGASRRLVRRWYTIRPDNHKLDLEVYCLGDLHILGPKFIATLGERAQQWCVKPESPEAAPAESEEHRVFAHPVTASPLPGRRGPLAKRPGLPKDWKRW